jgi:microcystin-dependent protein
VLGANGNFPNIFSEPPANADKISGITSTISGTTSLVGGSIPINILNPYVGIYVSIALYGIFPSRD